MGNSGGCVVHRKFMSFTPKRRISVEFQKMECYNKQVKALFVGAKFLLTPTSIFLKGREYSIEKAKKQTFGDSIDPWIYRG